jgi:signal transduction histidine kinase
LAFGLCFDVFLSNSQKYGATKVVFTLKDDTVLISDDGPGVPPERLSYLGVQKVVSSSSTGSGNGLLLSKQLLGLIGWTMDIQSTLGEGMTIRLHR